MGDDVQLLLAESWSDADVVRIAEIVACAGNRGHVVRAVQPGAADFDPDLVLMIDQDIAIEVHREFGVDLDQVTRPGLSTVLGDVFEHLVVTWADGGRLAMIPPDDYVAAARILASLSLKAAERAGCEIVGYAQLPDPLELNGWMRLDLDGLDGWIGEARPGVLGSDDRVGAARLRQLAVQPEGEQS